MNNYRVTDFDSLAVSIYIYIYVCVCVCIEEIEVM